jgi:hypothetical protein
MNRSVLPDPRPPTHPISLASVTSLTLQNLTLYSTRKFRPISGARSFR